MATTALTVGGFPLIGATPAGGRAGVTSLDGWLTTELRRARDGRTGRHGGYSSTGLRTPRPITVKGWISYADAADCAAERRTLAALGAQGADVPIVVTDALGELTVDVGVDRAAPTAVHDRRTAYTLDLTADDSIIVSTTPHAPVAIGAGSSAPVDNDGTAPADLVVTLTSGGTVVLTAGGITLVTEALPSGAVIDTGAESVRSSGGVDLLSLVTVARFPAVPAGGGAVAQAGTATLSVVVFDTYA